MMKTSLPVADFAPERRSARTGEGMPERPAEGVHSLRNEADLRICSRPADSEADMVLRQSAIAVLPSLRGKQYL